MSNKFISITLSCFLLSLLIAAPTGAQIPAGATERAVIPFDFVVRGKTLPAGTYTLRRFEEMPRTLEIENPSAHSHIMFETEPLERRNVTRTDELVFHRYGDTYFLRQIRIAGEEEGLEIATSRAERVLQNQSAKNNMNRQETLAIALN